MKIEGICDEIEERKYLFLVNSLLIFQLFWHTFLSHNAAAADADACGLMTNNGHAIKFFVFLLRL